MSSFCSNYSSSARMTKHRHKPRSGCWLSSPTKQLALTRHYLKTKILTLIKNKKKTADIQSYQLFIIPFSDLEIWPMSGRHSVLHAAAWSQFLTGPVNRSSVYRLANLNPPQGKTEDTGLFLSVVSQCCFSTTSCLFNFIYFFFNF